MSNTEENKPSFGQRFMAGFAKFGNTLAANRHFSAIRDGFALFIPVLLVGSIAVAFSSVIFAENSVLATNFFPKLGEQEWWKEFSFYVDPIFSTINAATMGFFALYFTIIAGFAIAQSYGDNPLYGAIISAASFLCLNPMAAGMSFMGAQGLMEGVIIGLTAPTVFHYLCVSETLKINLPDAVPPSIAVGLGLMIPIAITLFIFGMIQPVWAMIFSAAGLAREDVTINALQLSLTGGFNGGSTLVGDEFDYSSLDMLETNGGALYWLAANSPVAGGTISLDYSFVRIDSIASGNDMLAVWALQDASGTVFTLNNAGDGFVIVDNVDGAWKVTEDAYSGTLDIALYNQYMDFINSYASSMTTWDTLNINSIEWAMGTHTDKGVIVDDWYYLFNGVNRIFFAPLANLGRGPIPTGILLFFMAAFYLIGAHGPSVLAPLIEPLWTGADIHNVQLLAQNGADWAFNPDNLYNSIGDSGMYIFTMTTTVAFCRVGGTGFNFPTMICAAYLSKDAGQREIGKLAIGPGLFGVNEPITFGLPVVFNAVYFIPQLIPYVISGWIIFGFTAAGWAHPSIAVLPWSIPWAVAWFIGTLDWRAIIPLLLSFAVSFAFWIPWIMITSKRIVQKQAEEVEQTYGEYQEAAINKEADDIIWNKSQKPVNKAEKQIASMLEKADSLLSKGKTEESDQIKKEVEANQKQWLDEAEKEAEQIKSEITEKIYSKRDKRLAKLQKEISKDENKKSKKDKD